MNAPNIFLTANKTFSVALAWNAEKSVFERKEPGPGDIVFVLATPTRTESHEHYGGLSCVPRMGTNLDYSDTEDILWGNKTRGIQGLVREVKNVPEGVSGFLPKITFALAKIIRQECGMDSAEVPATTQDGEPTTVFQRVPAEGNSGSPSESDSAFTANRAEAVGTANADPA